MNEVRKGGCLCGKVRLAVELEERHYHTCHCSVCRGWGGPAMALPVRSVEVESGSTLCHYSASDYADRAFCSECGSHLYWAMKDGSYHAVHIGVLDDSHDLLFKAQLFVDQQPAHYAFANDTAMLTGADVLAQFDGETD